MKNLKQNLLKLQQSIEEVAVRSGRKHSDILLVAVTKQCTLEQLKEAYDLGLRDFAESRMQNLLEKQGQLPKDIRWHFIGRIQTNKIAKIIQHCFLIHSVPDFQTAEKIALASQKQNLATPILIQVNTSKEPSKSGLSLEEWQKELPNLYALKGIELKGMMTMAPLTEDKAIIRKAFLSLKQFQVNLEKEHYLPILSMGMSHDYKIAIEEGSTCLRIGSALFES